MKQIHKFAEKWLDKFKDPNIDFLELVGINPADDCDALGFEMDGGRAFELVYGDAFNNSDKLDEVIGNITNIPLIGSAIYSKWRYFSHLAYDSSEIMKSENRRWFISALGRMAELSNLNDNHAGVIIQFPKCAELKEEIEKLHTELSMLLLERDELVFVECKNIEMRYMLTLGALEYKAFELHCVRLRLMRKLDLIQAKKNRQEKVSIKAIEKILDEEFEEYREKLNEQVEKMNVSLKRSKGEFLTKEETKEIKALYRTVVKALHPDLNPDVSEVQIKLFQNAVEAYEEGDLITLRIINEMVAEPLAFQKSESEPAVLMKEKERLTEMLDSIKKQIAEIKSSYPYNLISILQSETLIAEKKAELEEIIKDFKEAVDYYNVRIKEIEESI